MRVLLPELEQMVQIFQGLVDFKLIYIMEAHTQDTWPISSARGHPTKVPVLYNRPINLEERMKIVEDFWNTYHPSMDIFVDHQDKFEEVYASWPMRWYVLRSGIVQYIETGYLDIEELRSEIQKLLE